jgi:uncharacterized membrane protein YccC
MSALRAGVRAKQWVVRRRRELRLSVRVTTAGLLALLVAQALNLPQGYWAVFAAVIVTETSVGGSVQAAVNWMVGTVGGAVYGAAVSSILPRHDEAMLALELVLCIAPLALLAALYPRFRVAPVTAIIVLATVNSATMGPLQSAIDRVLEIGLGSVIGLCVSLLVLPSRANTLVADAACRALEHMARLLVALTEAFGQHVGGAKLQPIHLEILDALSNLEDMVDEAVRERATRLSSAPDPAPLPRTLHRVRNDLVMLGRAVPDPFPEVIAARLGAAFSRTSAEIIKFLRDCAAALRRHQPPPSRETLEAAFDSFLSVLSVLRGEQLIRSQSAEMAGRVFALSFALQQLRADLKDLADRVAERV